MYSLEGLSSRFVQAREGTPELKDRSIEMIQPAEQKERRMKKVVRA